MTDRSEPAGEERRDDASSETRETTQAEQIAQLQGQLARAQGEIEYLGSFPGLNPAAIIEIDARGQITYVNSAAIALLPECLAPGGDSALLHDLPGMIKTLKNDAENRKHSLVPRNRRRRPLVPAGAAPRAQRGPHPQFRHGNHGPQAG